MPWQECIAKVDVDMVESIYQSCVYDNCATEETTDVYVCAAAASLVQACVGDEKVNITWRDDDFCRKCLICKVIVNYLTTNKKEGW